MSENDLSYLELQTRVQEKINNGDATILGYIKKWINDRYNDVISLEDWPFLTDTSTASLAFTSVAGGWKVALPSDFLSEVSQTVSVGDTRLIYADWNEAIYTDPARDDTAGVPTHYFFPYGRDGGYMGIYPKLNSGSIATVTFEHLSKVTALSADADLSLLPNRFRVKILVNGACADYFMLRKEPSLAQEYEAKYRQGINDMRVQLGINSSVGDEEFDLTWSRGIDVRKDFNAR
jgi:hypothetical protein